MGVKYQKYLGLFHHPDVMKELKSLDEVQDCERIAQILYCYEFNFDFSRALEVALFYTYASQPVAHLLNKTQQFSKQGQRRLEDTTILLALLLQNGWDSEKGKRVIARMNKTHGHYTIANDDLIFVLWTFIHFPIWWCDHQGRRKLSEKEKNAWFNFWYQTGLMMNIEDLPKTKIEMDKFIKNYEDEHFVATESAHEVMKSTLDLLTQLFPSYLKPMIETVALSMVPNPAFFMATGYQRPKLHTRLLVKSGFYAYAKLNRWLMIGQYPQRIENRREVKHRDMQNIENLKPKALQ